MKIDFSALAAMLIEQVANLTHGEHLTFAQQLGPALATFAKSSKTTIDDMALRTIAAPRQGFFGRGRDEPLGGRRTAG